MSNKWNTVVYTGVTNDLERRVSQHKDGRGGAFTAKYQVSKLVYYETFENVYDAIAREKQIKGGSRLKKNSLIEIDNPGWEDLAG